MSARDISELRDYFGRYVSNPFQRADRVDERNGRDPTISIMLFGRDE
jgi:hypothetical protein